MESSLKLLFIQQSLENLLIEATNIRFMPPFIEMGNFNESRQTHHATYSPPASFHLVAR